MLGHAFAFTGLFAGGCICKWLQSKSLSWSSAFVPSLSSLTACLLQHSWWGHLQLLQGHSQMQFRVGCYILCFRFWKSRDRCSNICWEGSASSVVILTLLCCFLQSNIKHWSFPRQDILEGHTWHNSLFMLEWITPRTNVPWFSEWCFGKHSGYLVWSLTLLPFVFRSLQSNLTPQKYL